MSVCVSVYIAETHTCDMYICTHTFTHIYIYLYLSIYLFIYIYIYIHDICVASTISPIQPNLDADFPTAGHARMESAVDEALTG